MDFRNQKNIANQTQFAKINSVRSLGKVGRNNNRTTNRSDCPKQFNPISSGNDKNSHQHTKGEKCRGTLFPHQFGKAT